MHNFILTILALCFLGIVSPSYSADNPDKLYQQGVAHGRQKNYTAAIKKLEKALLLSPENQDYRLALARVYSWSGKIKKAHQLVDKTLAAQPDNIEAKILKARLYYYQKKFVSAQTALEAIISKQPKEKEAKKLLTQVKNARNASRKAKQKKTVKQKKKAKKRSSAKPIKQKKPKPKTKTKPTPTSVPKNRWTLALGAERSTLSRRPQPDWRQRSFQLGYKISNNFSTYIRHENTERFHISNKYFELGMDYRFSDNITGNIAVGRTEEAIFLPEFRVKLGGQARVIHNHKRFGDTWLTLDLQYDRFNENTRVRTAKPGLRYAIFDSVTLSGKQINILADGTNKRLRGWSARIDWQTPWNRLRLSTEFSDAPESENGTTVVTKSRAIGATFTVNKNIRFYLFHNREDRENSFIRETISSALVFNF